MYIKIKMHLTNYYSQKLRLRRLTVADNDYKRIFNFVNKTIISE